MSFNTVLNANTGIISYNSQNLLNIWGDESTSLNNKVISGGNIGVVDSIYGNDLTGSFGGTPFLTISGALINALSGQVIYVLPGTYLLNSSITIPENISIIGFNQKGVIIQMNTTITTTMITLNNNCSIENVTILLNGTGNNTNISLTAVLFTNNSAQTSKINQTNIVVNNSTMSYSLSNDVNGIVFNGINQTESPLFEMFPYISINNSTISIYSNGSGNKRGILINNTNVVSIFSTNIFVSHPSNTNSTGSYVGVETNDINNLGSIQIRTSTIGTISPNNGDLYTSSDILQSTPLNSINISYLSTPGIHIGPGCDLTTKNAGGLGFSSYVYPTILYYGLKGSIKTGLNNAYLWLGTQAVSSNVFPDSGIPPAYFRAQHHCIICGLNVTLNVSPGSTYSVTLIIRCTPIKTGIITDTNFSVTMSGNNTSASFYNGSYELNTGDLIHLYMSYTGGNNNLAHDITAQIDIF